MDAKLVRDNATALFRAIKEGWGRDIEGMEYASLEHRTLLQLRYSAYVTAVFKNHHNSLEVASILFNDKGELRPFRKFQSEALKIMDTYNRAYLQSEYQTAVQTATHAAQWNKYQSRGGSLVLRTQGDGRVRNEHRLYDGATYPVNDPFWSTWYPPNGWRCRCFVTWKADEQTVDPEGLPDIQAAFRHNAGKQGTIFGDAHPYFEVSAEWAQRSRELFGYKPPIEPERVNANFSLYERLKDDNQHKLIGIDNMSGGVAFKNIEAPADNEFNARRLAGAGHGVLLNDLKGTEVVPPIEVNGKGAWGYKAQEAEDVGIAIRTTKGKAVVIDIRKVSQEQAEQEILEELGKSATEELYIITDKQTVLFTKADLAEGRKPFSNE